MKIKFKNEIISLLILAVVVLLAFYFQRVFPERAITHWNIAGEADGWSPRWVAAWLLPAIIGLVYLLMLFLPRLDPKKEKYQEFEKVYHIFKSVIIFFLGLIYVLAGLNNIGYSLPLEIYLPLVIGVMFIIMGKYMKEIKSNWFIGIRTPWTMSNEEVWAKTHQVGGRMFVAAGVLLALSGFLPLSWRLPVFLAVVIILLAGTIGYSYFAYRKINK